MNSLYALLVGIDCYLPNKLSDGASYRSLKGCVRDINHVEAFLKRQFNLPAEQIYQLTASNVDDSSEPSEPPSKWPTYENIVKMFQEVTTIAQSGDQVYIHYSGHGGRAVTIYPELQREKGFDEALVPLDIGKPTSRYLRDLELAALLQKMVSKGLVVTVVLDSCHSGGATRAGDSDIRGADTNTVDTTPRPTDTHLLLLLYLRLCGVKEMSLQNPNEFIKIVKTWSEQRPGIRLLLVIDQFEELITLSSQNEENKENKQSNLTESQQFLELLEAILAANMPQLSIVATLRSDFEPRFLNSEALKSYWTHARFPVRAMRSDELRQAIERPAAEMALYFEQLPGERNPVDKLVDEVGQMPGALPLLSFTLSELYIKLAKKWVDGESSDRALTLDAEFDKEGGVAVLRVQTKTLFDLQIVPKFPLNRIFIAGVNALFALAVALRGGEIISLILLFYTAYLSAVWVSWIAYLLEYTKFYTFFPLSVKLSLALGSLASLSTLSFILYYPNAVFWGNEEITIMIVSISFGSIGLLFGQLVEKLNLYSILDKQKETVDR